MSNIDEIINQVLDNSNGSDNYLSNDEKYNDDGNSSSDDDNSSSSDSDDDNNNNAIKNKVESKNDYKVTDEITIIDKCYTGRDLIQGLNSQVKCQVMTYLPKKDMVSMFVSGKYLTKDKFLSDCIFDFAMYSSLLIREAKGNYIRQVPAITQICKNGMVKLITNGNGLPFSDRIIKAIEKFKWYGTDIVPVLEAMFQNRKWNPSYELKSKYFENGGFRQLLKRPAFKRMLESEFFAGDIFSPCFTSQNKTRPLKSLIHPNIINHLFNRNVNFNIRLFDFLSIVDLYMLYIDIYKQSRVAMDMAKFPYPDIDNLECKQYLQAYCQGPLPEIELKDNKVKIKPMYTMLRNTLNNKIFSK